MSVRDNVNLSSSWLLSSHTLDLSSSIHWRIGGGGGGGGGGGAQGFSQDFRIDVQKYTFGVNWNWVSNTVHPIALNTQNMWILGCPNSAIRVSKRHPDTLMAKGPGDGGGGGDTCHSLANITQVYLLSFMHRCVNGCAPKLMTFLLLLFLLLSSK